MTRALQYIASRFTYERAIELGCMVGIIIIIQVGFVLAGYRGELA